MLYALIKYGSVLRYPYSIAEFRKEFPNIGIPAEPTKEQLDEVGLVAVAVVATPTATIDRVVIETTPVKIGEQWTQAFSTRAATQEEVAMAGELLKKSIVDGVQKRLDDFAKTRGYDGILSACSYAASTKPKFKAEGQYCVDKRDETWDVCYGVLADVESCRRSIPGGYIDIEPLLPPLEWPL